MFRFQSVLLQEDDRMVRKVTFHFQEQHLTVADIASLLASRNTPFVKVLHEAILSHGTEAIFWECPPARFDTFDTQLFEVVIITSNELASRSVDPIVFADKIADISRSTSSGVVRFRNPGRDATLVVPCSPVEDLSQAPSYMAHLASFIKNASSEHAVNLWAEVGKAYIEAVRESGNEWIWLSTSGLAEPWLHVRIDQEPKYYNWEEYKNVK